MRFRKFCAIFLSVGVIVSLLTGCGGSMEDLAEFPAMQELMAEADARRSAIRSSETAIVKDSTAVPGETYTGRAWYISNNGNDKNNGKSPEKALATLRGLEQKNVKPGDAVFFERGGLWRGEQVLWIENLTYSAYGEGEKKLSELNEFISYDESTVTLRIDRKKTPTTLPIGDLLGCDYARGDHGEE